MLRYLTDAKRPAKYWQFMSAAIVGGLASMSAGWATRALLAAKPETERHCIASFVGLAAFWLGSGLTWMAITRDNS